MHETVGRAVALMATSEIHRRYSVADLERLLLPFVKLDQIWVSERCLATWAWLTEEAEAGFLARTRKLRPGDMNAGERLWMIDFIAPFGDVRAEVEALRRHMYRRYGVVKARTCRTRGTGKVRKTGWFSNAALAR